MNGHKHAAILAQAAEDAKTNAKFYEKWERKHPSWSEWVTCGHAHLPGAYEYYDYRRKPAKPRECWAGWSEAAAGDGHDPWGTVWHRRQYAGQLHMIEVTPEVRAALAAAGIEVSP